MPVLKFQKHVNASPATVYGVASDLEHWADFVRGIERVELLTDGPMRAGTRFRQTRKLPDGETTAEIQVSSFEPPRGFELETLTRGMRITSSQRFLPDISGTLVEVTLEAKPASLAARLWAPFGKLLLRSTKPVVEAALEDLKAIAEQRAAADWVINPGRGAAWVHDGTRVARQMYDV